MIIMIHCGFSYSLPILRIAVPIFFILSSYFFFKKVAKLNKQDALQVYKKFLRRSIMLYLFWFVVLMPITIYARSWVEMNFVEILENFFIGLVLKNTFLASWYISAYIIGISIIFFTRNHNKLMLAFGLVCYIICCLTSNYGHLLETIVPYGNMPFMPFNSFMAGMLFISIGKYFAESKIIVFCDNLRKAMSYTIIGLLMLFLENKLIASGGYMVDNDSYFSLIVLAPAVFLLVKYLPQIKIGSTLWLRRYSVVNYCLHCSVIFAIGVFLHLQLHPVVLFFVVLLTCTLVAFVLTSLSKVSGFRFLKYSY